MAKASETKPAQRRLGRRQSLALHALAFVVGGTAIWLLVRRPPDRQFIVLFWLTLLCAHGLILYARRRLAFVFHLAMFSAGNAAIWSTRLPVGDKIAVNAAWALAIAAIGYWLVRNTLQAAPEAPAQRTKSSRAAADGTADDPPPRKRGRAPADDTRAR